MDQEMMDSMVKIAAGWRELYEGEKAQVTVLHELVLAFAKDERVPPGVGAEYIGKLMKV
jgi:hypothetical protein